LNIDKIWRRKVINIITQKNPERILDVATGTADLAIAASKKTGATIDGIDIRKKCYELGCKN
jgi:demethylmenaquinone methyltransferase/2-methoxy-6-polyprenyl-1,4-benzoquinol methylase